ncbi:MAG: DUF2147 domain-containing protein [Treponema sp.]|jgi:uncharacterized protein (DUF2147 family)|nr:DUF2147 domain-containing protein [Treponema sp.]
MKKALILALFFAVTGSLRLAADPVEGYWLSVDEKTGQVTGGWHIYQEGGKLYGKVLSMSEYPSSSLAVRCRDSYQGFPLPGRVSQMPVIGTPWIFGLTFVRPGEWSGGHVVNPEDGRMYRCKIIFRAADGRRYRTDVLEMRGEIGLGIGRSQFWQKTDQETASSLGPGE